MNRTWLLLPIGLLYGLLTVVPIGLMAQFSLEDGGTHYAKVLGSPLLSRVVQNTVVISLITTLVALLLGYVLATALWRAKPAQRNLLLAFILLPFWTAVLIKNFAWASLLQDNGAINNLLLALGFTDSPMTLLHNRFAVIVGMVHYVLPYAVFPIYTSMIAIDPDRAGSTQSRRCHSACGVAHYPAADASGHHQCGITGVHRLVWLFHHAGDPWRTV
jgi:ABC-type spermidine/putrescine transport system permease subunit I